MRVAVAHPVVGATGDADRVVVATIDGLVERGHDVHVLTTAVADRVLSPGATVLRIPLPRAVDPLLTWGFRERATTALARTGPYDAQLAFTALAPLGGLYWAPSVHTAGDEEILRTRSWSDRIVPRLNPDHRIRMARERSAWVPGGTRRLVAQAERVKHDATRIYGVPGDAVEVLHPGYDPLAFAPARRAGLRASTRASLGIGADARVVAFVADELGRTGFATLVQALADVEDVTLLVIGRLDAHAVIAKARRRRVDDRLVVVGASADVAVPLAAADALALLPSREVPWSMAVVEALASGLPVVTTSAGAASEVVRDGLTGALVGDPGDAAAVADGVRWALSAGGPADAEAIGASVAHLAWTTVLDRLLALLAR